MVTPMFLKGNTLAAPEPGSGGPTRSIFKGSLDWFFWQKICLRWGGPEARASQKPPDRPGVWGAPARGPENVRLP